MEFRIGFCSAAESKHAHANFTVQPVFQYVYIYMNLISFISPQKKDAKYVSEQLSLALWATFCDKWPQVSTAFRCGFCIYCWLAGISWPFFAGQQSVAMSACSGNWPLTESRPSPLAANQLRVRRIRRRELLRSGIWREKGCFKLKQSCSGK